MTLHPNDPSLRSWVAVAPESDFPIQNLPFGIFSPPGGAAPRAGVAIGNQVLDLSVLVEYGLMESLNLPDPSVFHEYVLNDFIALGKPYWQAVRARLSELLREDHPELRDNAVLRQAALYPMDKVEMHLPVRVGDYTDFYSSIEHATNVGKMFRPDGDPLLPNWRHLPVGYHGRASSIIPSGIPLHRPKGQTRPNEQEPPVFGPSKRVDFELEIAFITGGPTALGDTVSTAQADDLVFGFVLFNDWSARDLQKWEYVPLGPFLGKNFGSSVSPWIVTLDALEPFRVAGPTQEPVVLPYLQYQGKNNFDIALEVDIKPQEEAPTTICRSNYKYMYWNYAQQLAHHTVNGCNINPGDMYASGTISGPDKGSYGSMLELSWGGKEPIPLANGKTRTFVEDYDTVIIRGFAQNAQVRIGFGEVSCQILPAK
ncbi:fumarylacetoacetase [Eisenibacter elegans]|jgi:fumarylacetoacetase|uniref:fumarylacetoacetase n=1 Tax=Eisenibacter elegans TaxID=997 RepID=UPI000415D7D4|nr:fumarylacetoacetase [Eisenibacter elegans]